MKVSGDWLTHPGTQALCAALIGAGHRALIVGGAVRNALLGLPVGDIDLSTDALPTVVRDVAKAAGFKVVPTGIEHGTITVIAHGCPHEVTTFRRDVETDGRRAVVAFSTRIEDDAGRRDFTMNALYSDHSGAVLDPLGGLPDLLARRVRFVGDPETRIREDYLRILRFFRFHACYGDANAGLDAEGLAACAAHAEGLDGISKERIGAEMRKLLAAADPTPAVAAMAHSGVLSRLLPGADPRALGPLVHIEGAAPPDWLRRLAALGGVDAAEGLRLSRVEAREFEALREAIGSGESAAVLGWRLGAARATDALLLRASMLEQPLPMGAFGDVARGAATTFPLKAADLPGLQGPALGARLKALEARWLDSDLRLSGRELLGH